MAGIALLSSSWIFGRPRQLTWTHQSADSKTPEPLLAEVRGAAVVIPVRNEERNIVALLRDIERASQMGFGRPRVIVVDDGSTDRTVEEAKQFEFVEVIQAPPPPPGWTGKAWACHLGAIEAEGASSLVFVDADVRVAPYGLANLLNALSSVGGLVSIHPGHEVVNPYEQLSLYMELLAWMGSDAGRGPCRSWGAFGQVLATRANDYRKVGGHERVKDSIIEDVALARRYRECGLPVSVFSGAEDFRMRMYPGGIGQLWEGWTKNLASGAAATPPLRLAAAAVWLGGALSVAIDLARARRANRGAVILAGFLYAAYALQTRHMARQLGTYWPLTCWLFPIPMTFALAVFAWSTWKTFVLRSVTWRGRRLRVKT